MTEMMVKVALLVRDGDYKTWASTMRALMIGQKRLDKLLDAEPTSEEEAERDLLCRAQLLLHVAGPLKAVVSRATTAKGAWEALQAEHIGSLHIRQPMLMSALMELDQWSLTLVQYIDKAKELRDNFESLEMKESLPLLCQRFIKELSDELQIACGPTLHVMLRDKTKGLDDITAVIRSMALLLPSAYAMANTTRSAPNPKPNDKQRQREDVVCHYCGKKRAYKEELQKVTEGQAEG
jgi:hypothetical protein